LTDVERRLSQLWKAQEMVVEDLEIFRGTPIIRGTRIPVHDVADLMEAKTPMSELKELYPRLSHEQFDLALMYAKAHPRSMAGSKENIRHPVFTLHRLSSAKLERQSIRRITFSA
jgi:uncharacterized protein (DUF433 family)